MPSPRHWSGSNQRAQGTSQRTHWVLAPVHSGLWPPSVGLTFYNLLLTWSNTRNEECQRVDAAWSGMHHMPGVRWQFIFLLSLGPSRVVNLAENKLNKGCREQSSNINPGSHSHRQPALWVRPAVFTGSSGIAALKVRSMVHPALNLPMPNSVPCRGDAP